MAKEFRRPVFRTDDGTIGVQVDGISAAGCTLVTLYPVDKVEEEEYRLVDSASVREVYADQVSHMGYMSVSIDWLDAERLKLGYPAPTAPTRKE
jgi:hypothetical protein